MKKVLTLALALAMTLSLAACGGVDKAAVTEAFNAANTKLTALSTAVNENLDIVGQDSLDALNSIVDTMATYKAEIESKDLTQEKADELTTILLGVPGIIDGMQAALDEALAGGDMGEADVVDPAEDDAAATITEEQVATLNQLISDLTDAYNQYMTVYDNLDEDTKAMVDGLVADIELLNKAVGTVDAPSDQIDILIEGSQAVLAVFVDGWPQIEATLAGG